MLSRSGSGRQRESIASGIVLRNIDPPSGSNGQSVANTKEHPEIVDRALRHSLQQSLIVLVGVTAAELIKSWSKAPSKKRIMPPIVMGDHA